MRKSERLSGFRKIAATVAVVAVTGLIAAASWSGRADTYSACMTSHTVTHEIGPNQDNHHDRANGGNGGAYPYSYGYRNTTAGFRTIMAYSCPGGGCPRVNHMSNPNVLYNGWPTGIDDDIDPANSADNAR